VATGVTAGGPMTITATSSGISGTASLTVTAPPPPPSPPTLQTITVTPSPASVAVGSTVAFTATGHYSDGSSKNLTTHPPWTSTITPLPSLVRQAGVATGIAAGGPVTITATSSGISGTASLTVTALPPAPTLQTITITPSPASVAVNSTVAFTAIGRYSDG